MFALFGCAEKGRDIEWEHPILPAPVQLQISLDLEGRPLRDPYSYQLYTSPRYANEYLGYGGLAVVHRIEADYSVYDLACPYCRPRIVRIEMDGPDSKYLISATCPECHTVYDLAVGWGHPVGGPGKYPLLPYKIVLIGSLLQVY